MAKIDETSVRKRRRLLLTGAIVGTVICAVIVNLVYMHCIPLGQSERYKRIVWYSEGQSLAQPFYVIKLTEPPTVYVFEWKYCGTGYQFAKFGRIAFERENKTEWFCVSQVKVSDEYAYCEFKMFIPYHLYGFHNMTLTLYDKNCQKIVEEVYLIFVDID